MIFNKMAIPYFRFLSTKLLLSALIVLTFVSCYNDHTPDKPKQEIPKALEENYSSFKGISKRGDGDLVESLYGELLSSDLDLKKLEDKIEELDISKKDTTALFDKFVAKNLSYFNSAERHLSDIKDSLIREKMRNLVALQLKKYHSRIEPHNQLLSLIHAKQIAISDLHNVLKIVRTLPVIDNYQQRNLPTTQSLDGYLRKQQETLLLADTLTKK